VRADGSWSYRGTGQEIPREVFDKFWGRGRVTRENATAKGLRLLTEARLTVWRADGRRILAHCRGDSGEWYDVGYSRGSWYCSCPSFGRCSYLVALMRVTVRPGSALGFTNETETPAV
jgi:hypothetical protein